MRSSSMRRPRGRHRRRSMKGASLFAAWLALACGGALAQTEPPVVLSGTLAKVRTSGVVNVAHRDSSIPFSYLSSRGEPIGYSVELCRRLVEAMVESVGRERRGIRWKAASVLLLETWPT